MSKRVKISVTHASTERSAIIARALHLMPTGWHTRMAGTHCDLCESDLFVTLPSGLNALLMHILEDVDGHCWQVCTLCYELLVKAEKK